MLVYSPNNRHRARLTETDDGTDVAFDQLSDVKRRGINVSKIDTADLPRDAMWRQLSVGHINDRPFHVVRDHVAAILASLSMTAAISLDPELDPELTDPELRTLLALTRAQMLVARRHMRGAGYMRWQVRWYALARIEAKLHAKLQALLPEDVAR